MRRLQKVSNNHKIIAIKLKEFSCIVCFKFQSKNYQQNVDSNKQINCICLYIQTTGWGTWRMRLQWH